MHAIITPPADLRMEWPATQHDMRMIVLAVWAAAVALALQLT